MSERTKYRIRMLASDGHKAVDIARICGCSSKTVQRVKAETDLTKSQKSGENGENQSQHGIPPADQSG